MQSQASQQLLKTSSRNFGIIQDYNDRKKKGVSICKDIIMTNDNFSEYSTQLDKSKKKDDMADSFLQGLWYLRKYGHFQLDSAIYST